MKDGNLSTFVSVRGVRAWSVGGASTKCQGALSLREQNAADYDANIFATGPEIECVLCRLPFCPLNNARHAYAGGSPG